ncbi:alanine--tRNA ligase [uncultured Dubosiella sp.]|uniref:alanine--tRNA ligase n=1 Tax=uncultured Dubosiella sp. TaxID=1937011 RepID=UPI00272BCD6F|nr:alanine--tRNA ligase [uncultured Dubosiella sp.]
MKQLTGNQVRQMFLDYFSQQGHMIEPGASLIPNNDPTLLWINAGVAALKKYFDGSEKPRCNRIANAQKSIRTNDIENVGRTARHHTFFEMLGNFSIGDYFKEEAIPFAWEFLTSPDWMGIDKEKLYVSVYTDDQDAYRIWTEVCHVDPSHILKTDDNFWEIGKGPGGPDSEIFFDRGEKYDPQGLGERLFFEEMENDRYIEVWNVVFSQYDCDPEIDRKDYKELPQKNIDTGMGLERLVALIQDGETNFDTDLFLPIIHETGKYARYPYEGEYKMAYRVIADHIRTIVFALSDGANFSNSGRGYVLRRVLRRAARYGLRLGIDEPFLYKLVPTVNEVMKDFYPYLSEHTEMNEKLIKNEEETFKKTLKVGQSLLDEEIARAENGVLSGEIVFKLYDTYGFPFELTQEIAEEHGLKISREEFDEQMALQKERARNARNVKDSFASQNEELMNFTEKSEFVGYDHLSCDGKIIAIFKDGEMTDSLHGEGEIIFDRTCFYAESGGQVADGGTVTTPDAKAVVLDVQKSRNAQNLVKVDVKEGTLHVGQEARQEVDRQKRMRTTANHSCTHLLQSALKKVLGAHIQQAGSFVGPDYLRFDFRHFEKLTQEQLAEVEQIVNEYISAAYPVTKEIMDIETARDSGATALFNEKYGDKVRVVTMGDVSKEFCAGCHVDNTAAIGICKIVGEESIGSDSRRITAKTGLSAYEDFAHEHEQLENIAASMKQKGIKEIDEKVEAQMTSAKAMQKELEQLKNQIFALRSNEWINEKKQAGAFDLLIKKVQGLDGKAMKDIVSNLKAKDDNLIVLLIDADDKKAVFVAGAGKEAVKNKANAGQIVKMAANICGGNGGGKPDLAQAGGKDASKVDEAIELVENFVKGMKELDK